ncbi:MAG: pseudouridine synthase [Cyanobacteria bacterium]|jgi:23S rRNA pseudouridine2605 synthase|nr:pseudouridine synthase [Cyanobacteria bacterium GSL.Bin21]
MERVQKILSQWGIASRRQAEKMMRDGRVQVNGEVAVLGQKIDLQRDRVTVDGKPITAQERPQNLYLLINKPLGVVSTCWDPQNRQTVLDLLPDSLQKGQGLHPVGRLDINSTGALLVTNDGNLTLHLTHPRYHLPKTYEVWIKDNPSESVLKRWRNGIILDQKKTLPAQIKVLKREPECTLLAVTLTEGRNRQIRRVAEHLGFPVLALHRSAIGTIRLNRKDHSLSQPGNYRFLTAQEVNYLKQQSYPHIAN